MKKVQGVSFGVRFFRRGIAKAAIQNIEQDLQPAEKVNPIEKAPVMTDIPDQHAFIAAKPVKHHEDGLKEKALWLAARDGDCYAIRLLVMDGVDLDKRDPQGRTAINIATQYNQTQALKTLMAAKEMRYMASMGDLPEGAFFEKFKNNKTGND